MIEDRYLPVVYLSILVVLLAGTAFFVLRQLLRTRRTERTLNQLNRLTKEKGTAKEHYEYGGILLDKKLYTQAIAQFQKALKAKDLEGNENKALIYNALGFSYAAQEQFDLAIRQYKEALEILPEYPTALNNIGFAYEKKQLMTQALESYDEALRIDPKNATAKRRSDSLRKRVAVPQVPQKAEK